MSVKNCHHVTEKAGLRVLKSTLENHAGFMQISQFLFTKKVARTKISKIRSKRENHIASYKNKIGFS